MTQAEPKDRRAARARRGAPLTRADWVAAARAILIGRGIGALGVRGLAARLGATPGAFYWLFESTDDLHEDIRQDWAERNSAPFTRAIAEAGADGLEQYLAWVRVLVLEDEFDPGHDNAMRDWAHGNARTAGLLQQVERARIAELRAVFEAMGFGDREAEIRARVTYYHQVGYNAMRVRETREERLANVPYYAEILTDTQALRGLEGPDAVLRRLMAAKARR